MNTPKNDPTQPTQLTPISQAATYEEIGEFWDTHSAADYEDQMVECQDWHGISEASLRRVWNNDQDAIFDNWRDLYDVLKGDITPTTGDP